MTEKTTPTIPQEKAPVEFVEVLARDEEGKAEVVQVEEPNGQHRMHFVGLDE